MRKLLLSAATVALFFSCADVNSISLYNNNKQTVAELSTLLGTDWKAQLSSAEAPATAAKKHLKTLVNAVSKANMLDKTTLKQFKNYYNQKIGISFNGLLGHLEKFGDHIEDAQKESRISSERKEVEKRLESDEITTFFSILQEYKDSGRAFPDGVRTALQNMQTTLQGAVNGLTTAKTKAENSGGAIAQHIVRLYEVYSELNDCFKGLLDIYEPEVTLTPVASAVIAPVATPVTSTPVIAAPVVDPVATPVASTPVITAPVADPVATPVASTPVITAPVVDPVATPTVPTTPLNVTTISTPTTPVATHFSDVEVTPMANPATPEPIVVTPVSTPVVTASVANPLATPSTPVTVATPVTNTATTPVSTPVVINTVKTTPMVENPVLSTPVVTAPEAVNPAVTPVSAAIAAPVITPVTTPVVVESPVSTSSTSSTSSTKKKKKAKKLRFSTRLEWIISEIS